MAEKAEIEPQTGENTMHESKGNLKFEKVSMSYRSNTEKVLKTVSFEVKSGEKIGIVGRTGAGKSSIGQVLARIVEL